MDYKNLTKANELGKRIKELDSFIRVAERVWTGKLIQRELKYIFKSNQYGIYNSQEYEIDMGTEMKNKMLDILREQLQELKLELEKL